MVSARKHCTVLHTVPQKSQDHPPGGALCCTPDPGLGDRFGSCFLYKVPPVCIVHAYILGPVGEPSLMGASVRAVNGRFRRHDVFYFCFVYVFRMYGVYMCVFIFIFIFFWFCSAGGVVMVRFADCRVSRHGHVCTTACAYG